MLFKVLQILGWVLDLLIHCLLIKYKALDSILSIKEMSVAALRRLEDQTVKVFLKCM